MAFKVIDTKTGETVGTVATPWLLEKGGGKAWSEPNAPHIWMAVDYPGAVVPEGATIKTVRIIHWEPCNVFNCEGKAAGHTGKHEWEEEEAEEVD